MPKRSSRWRRGSPITAAAQCGGAAQRRCGRPVGGALQPQGTGRRAARPWRRSHPGVWTSGAGTDPGRGAADARPGGGWDRHLVADHPATGPAARPRRAAQGEYLYHLVRAARCGAELAAGSQLVRDRHGTAQAQGRDGDRPRPGCPSKKSLIEAAYTQTVLPVWTEDEAGPFTTAPFPGQHWRPEGEPERYPHEYLREGTAKQLTLFHPASGLVRVKGVTSTANAVVHPWLEGELTEILAALPEPDGAATGGEPALLGALAGGAHRAPQPAGGAAAAAPALGAGQSDWTLHQRPSCAGCSRTGIMPLYTPLSGSYLNMAESIQRILKRRALSGQQPTSPEEIIGWLEAAGARLESAPDAVRLGWEAASAPRACLRASACRRWLGGRNGAARCHDERRPETMAISMTSDPLGLPALRSRAEWH